MQQKPQTKHFTSYNNAQKNDKQEESINSEAQKLQVKENELLNKAKEVEQEMNQLKDQKLELLTKLFREQLYKDFEQENHNFDKNSQQEFENEKKTLDAEKSKKMEQLNRLQYNIIEQMKTFQMILDDLKDKKEEIEHSHLAAQEYLKREKSRNQEEYRKKSQVHIEQKVKDFKDQLLSKKI